MSDHTDDAMVRRITREAINQAGVPIWAMQDDAGLEFYEYEDFARIVIKLFLKEEHGDG